MPKIKTLNKWFAVQLSNYVLCGEISTKWGPKTIYTGTLWGLQGEYAVCHEGFNYDDGTHILNVYKLGSIDKAWIKSKEADVIDNFELN